MRLRLVVMADPWPGINLVHVVTHAGNMGFVLSAIAFGASLLLLARARPWRWLGTWFRGRNG